MRTVLALTARKPASAYATPPTRCSKWGGREQYMIVNSNVIADTQPCLFFDSNRKERFAWGISRIYDNVRVANLSVVY